MARSCSLTLIAAATWRVALGVQRHASPVAQQEHEVLASQGACPVPQWASSENVVIFKGYCYATRSFKDPMNEDPHSKPSEQSEEHFADGWQFATYSDELADFLTQYVWGSYSINLKNSDDPENCVQLCTKALYESTFADCKTEGNFKHVYDGRIASDCGIASNRPHASSTKTVLIQMHKASTVFGLWTIVREHPKGRTKTDLVCGKSTDTFSVTNIPSKWCKTNRGSDGQGIVNQDGEERSWAWFCSDQAQTWVSGTPTFVDEGPDGPCRDEHKLIDDGTL